jgi:hypothetical protein
VPSGFYGGGAECPYRSRDSRDLGCAWPFAMLTFYIHAMYKVKLVKLR